MRAVPVHLSPATLGGGLPPNGPHTMPPVIMTSQYVMPPAPHQLRAQAPASGEDSDLIMGGAPRGGALNAATAQAAIAEPIEYKIHAGPATPKNSVCVSVRTAAPGGLRCMPSPHNRFPPHSAHYIGSSGRSDGSPSLPLLPAAASRPLPRAAAPAGRSDGCSSASQPPPRAAASSLSPPSVP